MAHIELTSENLIVHVEGLDKLWALKSSLSISLAHITGAEVNPSIADELGFGLRAPGTSLPGVIRAGTFYYHGNVVFWDVHGMENAIVINLMDEHYTKLVIEVPDPDVVVAAIRHAIDHRDR